MFFRSKKRRELLERLAKLEQALLAVNNLAFLVSIERVDRKNRFVFVRHGKVVVVETHTEISDDLPAWKRELLR